MKNYLLLLFAFLLFVSCNNEELNYFGSPKKKNRLPWICMIQ